VRTKARKIAVPERPADLIYALEEMPPWPHLLDLGFQHVAVVCPYLVMVALVAEAAKLPHAVMVEEQSFVSGLSGYLSGLHADRIERSAKGEDCEIKLVFRL
jgi:xanthine/uracil permease